MFVPDGRLPEEEQTLTILWALPIASVAYGSLLGVFLLGTLTRRANEAGTIVGMIVGLGVNIFLWLQPAPVTLQIASFSGLLPRIAWTWYVVIGTR